jgi:hypothetical protein
LLLFPGFLTYHYGISAGWWGALFGGLFGGGVAVTALAAGGILLQRGAMRQPLGALHLVVLATLTYVTAWSLVGWIGIRHGSLAGPVMAEAGATVLIWIAMLFVGARLPLDPAALRRMSGVGMALALLCFAHAFYVGGFPGGPFLAFVSAEEGGHATYQGIGRSMLAIALVAALALQPGSTTSLVVLLGGALLILSLGSRAHFFVLGVSILLHLALLVLMRRTRAVGIAGLLMTSAAVVAGASVFLETRAAEIFDLASSSSWEERGGATARALEVIAEHPLGGLYGYHAWDSAGYAHNALSAWTQYGLVGFLAFSATTLCSLYVAVAGFAASRGREPAWHLALHFNLIAIVLAITSEPVMSSVFPALAWGLTLRAQNVHRASRASSRG